MQSKECQRVVSAPYSKRGVKLLIAGVAGLLQSQLRLMEELGLSARDLYPLLYELTVGQDLVAFIEEMISSGRRGVTTLTHVFSALAVQQKSLLSALDQTVLQSCEVLHGERVFDFMRKRVGENAELKNSAQLRYKKIIVPALIKSFLRCYEESDSVGKID